MGLEIMTPLEYAIRRPKNEVTFSDYFYNKWSEQEAYWVGRAIQYARWYKENLDGMVKYEGTNMYPICKKYAFEWGQCFLSALDTIRQLAAEKGASK